MNLQDFRATLLTMTPDDAAEVVCPEVRNFISNQSSMILVYAGDCWIELLPDNTCHLILETEEHFGAQADMEALLHAWAFETDSTMARLDADEWVLAIAMMETRPDLTQMSLIEHAESLTPDERAAAHAIIALYNSEAGEG